MIRYPLNWSAYIKSMSEYSLNASTLLTTFSLSLLLRQVLQIFILRIPSLPGNALNCSSGFSIPQILHFFIYVYHLLPWQDSNLLLHYESPVSFRLVTARFELAPPNSRHTIIILSCMLQYDCNHIQHSHPFSIHQSCNCVLVLI